MKINNQKVKSLFLLSLVDSCLGKKDNQIEIDSNEISLNSLPQMGTNLTKRQNNLDTTLVFGGYPVLMADDQNSENTKNCMISFFSLHTNSSDCSYNNFSIGILTSSLCSPITADSEYNTVRVFTRDKSLHLGDIINTNFADFNILTDFDYSLAGIFNTFTDKNIFLSYVSGLTTNDKTVSELYPITGTSSPSVGAELCAYGAGSGYHCGILTEIDKELTIPSPWTSDSNLTFQGLSKVDLGTGGFESAEDTGGPVYHIFSQQGQKTAVNALGHITWLDNSDPNHKLVYYTPVDKALSAIFNNIQCSYTLLTSNDTSAKEFQAQIEVSTKT